MATVKTPNTRYIGKSFQTTDGYVKTQSFTAPAAASATAILSAQSIASGGTVTTFAGQPDVARNLQVVASGAATGNVVVTGTDIRGAVISETLALNGTTPVIGNKAFASITSVALPTVAATTINLGTSTKLGLTRCLPGANTVFVATTDGATDTAPTVATNATVISNNTVIMNTAPNGTHNYLIAFVSTELTTAA